MATAHSRLRPAPEGLPARLRAAREGRGLSQGELGRLAGVAQMSVSKWERGASEPSISQATALARALGVGVEWLATGEGRGPLPR